MVDGLIQQRHGGVELLLEPNVLPANENLSKLNCMIGHPSDDVHR